MPVTTGNPKTTPPPTHLYRHPSHPHRPLLLLSLSLLLLLLSPPTTLSTSGRKKPGTRRNRNRTLVSAEAVDPSLAGSGGVGSGAGIRGVFGGGSGGGMVGGGGEGEGLEGFGDGEGYGEYYGFEEEEEEEEEEEDWNLNTPSTNPESIPKRTPSPRPEHHPTSSSTSSSSKSKKSNSKRYNEPSPPSSGKEAVIVCGVDGTIYTLDAWTGQLRGSFQSGGEIVKGAAAAADDDDDYDDEEEEGDGVWEEEEEEGDDNPDSWHDEEEEEEDEEEEDDEPPKEEIIPGLDGKLYALTDSHHLDMLQFDIQTVIDTPTSTCRRRRRRRSRKHQHPNVNLFTDPSSPPPSSSDDEILECGLVMGQRSTKTFAIDPSTGTVRWMQSPEAGAGGFTSRQTTMGQDYHERGGGVLRGEKIRTVLLQREDYMVRQVDMDSGEEFWSVKMGKFSALHFPNPTHHHPPHPTKHSNEDLPARPRPRPRPQTLKEKYPTSIRPRLPTIPLRTSPNIITATTKLLHQFHSAARASVSATLQGYYDNMNIGSGESGGKRMEDGGNQRVLSSEERARASSSSSSSADPPVFVIPPPFPSIAFGEDGQSLIAIEGRTGELLWRRKIESVVAAVYGVGRESRWVALDMRDEKDVVYPYGNGGDGDGVEEEDTVILEEEEEEEGKVVEEEEGDEVSMGLQRYDWMTNSDTNALLTILPLSSQTIPHQFTNYPHPHLHTSPPWDHPQLGDGTCRIPPCDHLPPRPIVNAAKIGRHRSTLFVHSTLRAPPGKDYPFLAIDSPPPPPRLLNFPLREGGGGGGGGDARLLEGGKAASSAGWGGNEYTESMEGSWTGDDFVLNDIYRMTISQHTQNGLFLTWSMIALLTLCIFMGMFIGRVMYHKKKKSDLTTHVDKTPQQELTPKLEKTLSESTRNIPVRNSPPTRSLSLPELNTEGSQRFKNSQHAVSQGDSVPPFQLSPTSDIRSLLKGKEQSLVKTNGQIIKYRPRSGSSEGVSDVEGFPLLRYSRYNDEFKEISRLGRGGFGTVFKCCQKLDKREYAVKKVLIQSLVDSDGERSDQFKYIINRVLREVKILAAFDHPNIVRYYTAWLEVETKDDETATQDDCEESSTNGNGNGNGGAATGAIGYSSGLLLGRDPSGRRSFSRRNSSPGDRRMNQCSISRHNSNSNNNNNNHHKASLLKDNPLGEWNSFLDESTSLGSNTSTGSVGSVGSVDDSWTQARRSRHSSWNQISCQDQPNSFCSVASLEDLGFSWDRDSGVASTSNLKSLNVAAADNLSTIHDHDGSASENDSGLSEKNNESERSGSCSPESTTTSGEKEKSDKNNAVASTSNLNSLNVAAADNLSTIHDHDGSASENDCDLSKKNNESKRSGTCSPESTTISGEKEKSDKNNALADSSPEFVKREQISQKHILYIQMQLSQKTLLDYFDDRKNSGTKSVDIITSLKVFVHIARGLKHVHEKGLIHRDLKPSNCFMDGSEVKIGDFGLSRSDNDHITHDDDNILEKKDDSLGGDEDITTKVGTSSYASPEQINGSNYNSSTDIFSLGILLFELCYPMYTGMERYKVFEGIRRQIFPLAWKATVAENFSSLDEILTRMLSPKPEKRPSASEVLTHIESLIEEYSLSSLDHTTAREGSFFLRVEADDSEGVLPRTIETIKKAASNVTIQQYSLIKRQEQGAIMEFALIIIVDIGIPENNCDKDTNPIGTIVNVLSNSPGINNARVVNERPTVQDVNK